MNEKVILICVDGMRPDALTGCNNPYVKTLLENSAYTLKAQTVMPSVTLPVHCSMFLSVPPERHGVTTNVFSPPVRPIDGLFEVLSRAGKRTGMFYSWGELRDVCKPYALSRAVLRTDPHNDVGDDVTNDAIRYIETDDPDFVFVYLGATDEVGHNIGWMSDEQLRCVSRAVDNIHRLIHKAKDRTFIITADHGGHERMHGTNVPEDMTVPMIFFGNGYAPRVLDGNISVLDIAPTVAMLTGCAVPHEWEGRAVPKE